MPEFYLSISCYLKGNYFQALEYVKQGLQYPQDGRIPDYNFWIYWFGLELRYLEYEILIDMDLHDQATSKFQIFEELFKSFRSWEEFEKFSFPQAGLAKNSLKKGETSKAVKIVLENYRSLLDQNFTDYCHFNQPGFCYWFFFLRSFLIAYQVFKEIEDPRAEMILNRGYQLLQE